VITSVNGAFSIVSSEHIFGDFVLLSSFCSFLMTVYLALGLVASELTVLLLKSQVLLERLSATQGEVVLSKTVKSSLEASFKNWGAAIKVAGAIITAATPPALVIHTKQIDDAMSALGTMFSADMTSLGLGAPLYVSAEERQEICDFLHSRGASAAHESPSAKRKKEFEKVPSKRVVTFDADEDRPGSAPPPRGSRVMLYPLCTCARVGKVFQFGNTYYSLEKLQSSFQTECTLTPFDEDLLGCLVTQCAKKEDFLSRVPIRIPDRSLPQLEAFWGTRKARSSTVPRPPDFA